MNQRIVREVAIESEGNFAQQEVADRVDAVLVDQHIRLDNIAQALAHLLSFDSPPAMGEDLFRQRQAGSHQEGRPGRRHESAGCPCR